MFRYIATLLLLAGLFAMPILADEKDPNKGIQRSGPCAPVAHVTSFEILVVNIKNGENDLSAVRIMADGNFACKRKVTTDDGNVKKNITVEIETKLTAEELKGVQELFAKLQIDTLETVKLDEEPEKFIIIQAHDGHEPYKYGVASLTAFGEYTTRVGPFVKMINKLLERLK